MRAPRLLFYAVNGLGLGHITRMLALARALRKRVPAAEMLFLTTSEAAHIVYREGFAALKLPSRNAAQSGLLRHGSWLRLLQSVTLNSMAAFDPHVLIVDSFAAGTAQELLPLLRWPLRKVFVYRTQRPERATDPFFQSTLRLYDLILIPHEAGEEELPLPPEVPHVWTGPMRIRDRDELLSRDEARAALNLPAQGEIALLTLGGGGEPTTEAARNLFFKAASALQKQGVSGPLWIETRGPLLRLEPTRHNETGSPDDGTEFPRAVVPEAPNAVAPNGVETRLLRDVQPLMPYLQAFDYAVSAAGYNTVNELLAARLPSLLWPFARDLDDQAARVRALAARGMVLQVGEGIGNAVAEDGKEDSGAEGPGSRAPKAAGEVRRAELEAALCDLANPAVRESLRAAMSALDALNGTEAGADAVLKLLP